MAMFTFWRIEGNDRLCYTILNYYHQPRNTVHMKRYHRRRRSRRRRSSLSASNWGPILALSGTVLGIIAVIALVIFVGLPKLLPLIGISYRAPFSPTPTPAPTPAPTPTPNPMELFDANLSLTEGRLSGFCRYF